MMTAWILATIVAATPSTATSTATPAKVSEAPANDHTLELAQCKERVKALREGLDQVAKEDSDVLSHWPSIVLGAVCIGSVAVFGNRENFTAATTSALVTGCGALGVLTDALTWSPPTPTATSTTAIPSK